MPLLDLKNKFLFEAKPSVFPEGELTGTELILWELYYTEKKNREAK